MEKVGLVGAEMAFGTVQHVFQTLYEGRAVALGYMRYHRFMELAVPQHKKVSMWFIAVLSFAWVADASPSWRRASAASM